jgi:hypothetical protein
MVVIKNWPESVRREGKRIIQENGDMQKSIQIQALVEAIPCPGQTDFTKLWKPCQHELARLLRLDLLDQMASQARTNQSAMVDQRRPK